MTSTQRTVAALPCDQCLHRKIRCNKSLPRCLKCEDANLDCTRDVVRRRPGRKKGSGNVISSLRSAGTGLEQHVSKSEISPQYERKDRAAMGWSSIVLQNPKSTAYDEDAPLHSISNEQVEEHLTVESSSPHALSTDASPRTQAPSTILSTIPNLTRHIDLFFEKLYPIWPIIDETSIRTYLGHLDNLENTQICLILSICALGALHIPETASLAMEPRKLVAQRFIKDCLKIRSQFLYIETANIHTVQTSLFLSCAEVEFHRVRSSFFLLRESIMLAQELGFYETPLVAGLNQSDTLCIRRTLYLLNLVERGLTILRNKPFAINMYDSPPQERFPLEDSRVLTGLQSLSQLFNLLDRQFLDNWVNNTPGTPESTAHLVEAQYKLACMTFDVGNLIDIQKADILIAQQWLRLVFWQSSMKQGIVSSKAEHAALSFQFPCQIARSLCAVLESLPNNIIFLHGIAIVCSSNLQLKS